MLAKNTQTDEFLEYVVEEYEEIRQDYFENLKDKKYLTLSEARKRKLRIDWNNYNPGNCKIMK